VKTRCLLRVVTASVSLLALHSLPCAQSCTLSLHSLFFHSPVVSINRLDNHRDDAALIIYSTSNHAFVLLSAPFLFSSLFYSLLLSSSTFSLSLITACIVTPRSTLLSLLAALNLHQDQEQKILSSFTLCIDSLCSRLIAPLLLSVSLLSPR